MASLWALAPGVGDSVAWARQRGADAVPVERRVTVFEGVELVVPLAGPAGETAQSGWLPAREPRAEWGAEPARAQLRYFAPPASPASGHGWLVSAGEWASSPLPAARGTDRGAGFWALLVEAPRAMRGRPLRIDGRTVPAVWFDEPGALPAAGRLPPVSATPQHLASLEQLLGALSADPFQRWRAALVLDRLSSDTELAWPADGSVAALARQIELRWRAAFSTLARDDADLSADVLARATAIVTMPDGPLLPAWTLDEPGLALLREDLLDPDSFPGRRTERARAWLQADPAAIAWVIDDAGLLSGPGPYALVGVANPGRSHAVASLAVEGEAAENPTRLNGQASVSLRAFFGASRADGTVGSAVIARLGAWSRPLPIRRAPTAPSPPGLVLGPLMADWDLVAWRTGAPVPVIGERAAVALVSLAPDGRTWDLYIESRFPPGDPPAREKFRVYLGPREGNPRTLEVGPGAASGAPVAFDSDRWRAVVALPIEPQAESVHIGLERIEDSGRRSAWPRPMTPGQLRGPGRAVIDLTSWGDLRTPGP